MSNYIFNCRGLLAPTIEATIVKFRGQQAPKLKATKLVTPLVNTSCYRLNHISLAEVSQRASFPRGIRDKSSANE